MLKISLLVLAVVATCHGGRLPSKSRFQRQEVLESAPYPPSGFRPEGTGFELPNENALPEPEFFENNEGIETFDRLKTTVKSEKLVQQQAVPAQPQLSPFNYAVYQQQGLLQGQQSFQSSTGLQTSQIQQPSAFGAQQFNVQPTLQNVNQQPAALNVQQSTAFGAQQANLQAFNQQAELVQPAVLNAQQPTAFGAQQANLQPFNQQAEFVQPTVLNAQQPTAFGAQQANLQPFNQQAEFIQPTSFQQPGLQTSHVQQTTTSSIQPQPQFNFQQVQQPQPTIQQFNTEVQQVQPILTAQQPTQVYRNQAAFFNAQLQQPAYFTAQLQQPALYNGQLLQNCW